MSSTSCQWHVDTILANQTSSNLDPLRDSYPSDGIHISDPVLKLDSQVLLNMYCNNHMNYNDGTCCSDGEPVTVLQIITGISFVLEEFGFWSVARSMYISMLHKLWLRHFFQPASLVYASWCCVWFSCVAWKRDAVAGMEDRMEPIMNTLLFSMASEVSLI